MKLLYWFTLVLIIAACSSCKEAENGTLSPTADTALQLEKHRPHFHFTPATQWMNDPNGMFYHDGEYHLFYQYYPEDIVWGPMHWGHAVSEDLVHWDHLPIALYPDDLGYIFSGSAVVDHQNTSGLGENGAPPLIAIFTHHNPELEKSGSDKFQYQSIAFSNDRGRSWTKYEGNPVVPNPGIRDFRDPKVIWHEETGHWVMVFAAYDKVILYTSPDLKNWKHASDFGIEGDDRLWECPDLFPMKVKGSDETKWVLITSIQKEAPNGGTASSYFVGDFDGKRFIGNPMDQQWLDYGRDNYAFVTWSDVPESDGRRLGIGWMSNWQYAQDVPTDSWRSAMTMSRELELINTSYGYRVISKPAKEYKDLRARPVDVKDMELNGSAVLLENKDRALCELSFTALVENADLPEKVFIRISNANGEYYDVGFDYSRRCYFGDRRNSGMIGFSEKFADKVHYTSRVADISEVDFRIFLDVASSELYGLNGERVITDIFFPNEDYTKVELFSDRGNARIKNIELHELNGIW